jgi:hypothetical protein
MKLGGEIQQQLVYPDLGGFEDLEIKLILGELRSIRPCFCG